MITQEKKLRTRKLKRAMRVRKALKNRCMKPRLSVNKSNAHIYVQLIDDKTGKTLCSCSTLSLKREDANKANIASAKIVGEEIAKKSIALGVKEITFDRGPFKYHGVLAALADAARQSGLEF
jgi:large subunit ribosomal protein L18